MIAALVAGCSSGPKEAGPVPTGQKQKSHSSGSTSGGGTAASTSVPLCGEDNTDARVDSQNGAAGTIMTTWRVTNTSSEACRSFGYPGMDFHAASGWLDVQVQRGGGVQIDSVKVTFGQDVLFLQDLAVLALIRQNLGKRAIYFSWSDGGYPDQTFGLEPYLVSQGMVRKLLPNKVVANDSMVSNPILGMVDLPRTNELLWNAYHWKAIARSRPRGWVDPPSSSILQLYAVIYRGMAETYRAQGNMKLAIEADRISQEIRTNLQPIQ